MMSPSTSLTSIAKPRSACPCTKLYVYRQAARRPLPWEPPKQQLQLAPPLPLRYDHRLQPAPLPLPVSGRPPPPAVARAPRRAVTDCDMIIASLTVPEQQPATSIISEEVRHPLPHTESGHKVSSHLFLQRRRQARPLLHPQSEALCFHIYSQTPSRSDQRGGARRHHLDRHQGETDGHGEREDHSTKNVCPELVINLRTARSILLGAGGGVRAVPLASRNSSRLFCRRPRSGKPSPGSSATARGPASRHPAPLPPPVKPPPPSSSTDIAAISVEVDALPPSSTCPPREAPAAVVDEPFAHAATLGRRRRARPGDDVPDAECSAAVSEPIL